MKTIKILFIAIIGSLLSTSCLVDDEADTKNQVETPMAIGFKNSQATVSYFQDIGSVEHEFYFEIKGGQHGFTASTLTVDYQIDPASTASAGTEFDILSPSLTIDANRDFGTLRLNVNTGSLNPSAPTELIVHLTSDVHVIPDAFKTLKIIFIGCQSQLAGTYTNPDLPSGAGGQTDFAETTPNNFTFTMPFLGFGGTNPIEMYLVDICGELTLTGWEVETAVSGDVSVDPVTGAITIDNLVIYNGANVDPNDIWFDLGSSTYTPL